ncbi:hypothetical protein KUF89_01880 [Streptococcus equi subsp. zooepidemicus]|uniref:hypothetical protein n=1 Tax=Streptococcus equi TaxID=1336 RepID=UPI001E3578F7|nr:hypothetical protein [Streptococcus equi]MCD3380033.1 hypothetical protein [Streptococcus equi subsp. zooepidemicus]MCD3409302.1 hypothetical protein [Streptococcus equi subsp. zooepidemicus]MCD3464840.1 hypothetical protein [Streptococcus equi subsp. zooepidemicus]HEL0663260.1 hypothetical protein [Streptococcus equi subsp. zooepidemicus]HEL1205293.1 hypothetical protein [Streptococcus equi subsp. zooepidemicus]
MKSKLFGLIVLVFSAMFLVACSNDSLDGEYYWISEHRNEFILTIKGDVGVLRSEGTRKVKVDKDLKLFEVSGFMNPSVKYEYKDGVLTANLTGVENDFYKKGTKACKEALKKYGYKEVGKE